MFLGRDVEGDRAVLQPVGEAVEMRGLIQNIWDKIYYRKRKVTQVYPIFYVQSFQCTSYICYIHKQCLVTKTNEQTCQLVPDNGLEI